MGGVQLDVRRIHTDNVGEDENGILSALVLGVGEVGSDWEWYEKRV